MRGFFDRLSVRLAEFMQGRYGSDKLNAFILGVAIVCIIVSLFVPYASFVSWILLAIAIFRSLSTNHARRAAANAAFEKFISGPAHFFNVRSNRWKNRKTTIYFKCPECKQNLSVPRGKGKIRIICPKCGHEIFRNS